jgi:hypothetical protein
MNGYEAILNIFFRPMPTFGAVLLSLSALLSYLLKNFIYTAQLRPESGVFTRPGHFFPLNPPSWFQAW